MFISVKALTSYMDDTIKYYNEGVASKEQHDLETYNKWYASITSTMRGQLAKLKSISTNKKVIAKYENIINDLLK